MKTEQKLTRLYWKTDKEKIEELLQSLNPKYLVSLSEKSHKINNRHRGIEIKYSGYIFLASGNTIDKECWRRVEKGTLAYFQPSDYGDYALWHSNCRFGRFAYIVEHDKNNTFTKNGKSWRASKAFRGEHKKLKLYE